MNATADSANMRLCPSAAVEDPADLKQSQRAGHAVMMDSPQSTQGAQKDFWYLSERFLHLQN